MMTPGRCGRSRRLPTLLLAWIGVTTHAAATELFDHPVIVPSPATPDAVVGDFNGDGRQDLAVINTSVLPLPGLCPQSCDPAATIRLFLGDGATTFTPAAQVPAGCNPNVIVAGDFTGDGILDVTTLSCQGDTLALFQGDGTGGLHLLFETPSYFGPLSEIVAGDVDGDGVSDILGASLVSFLVRLRYNQAGPNFLQSTTGGFRPPPDSRLALGDLDGDGHPDVVASARYDGSFVVYRGDGAGNFAAVDGCPFDNRNRAGGGVALADLDGEGSPEIIVAGGGLDGLPGSAIDRFQRGASGLFCPGWGGVRRTLDIEGEIVAGVAVADFDGDGRIDLATSGNVPPGAPGEETTALVRLYPNDGRGFFGTSTAFPVWESEHRLVVADVNADARPDLVAVGRVNERTLAGHAHILLNGIPNPPVVQVTMATGPDRVTWVDAGADSYDVIYGDLGMLDATGGRFDIATRGCVADDVTTLEAGVEGPIPPTGDGWFYLVRGHSVAGATYDSGGRAQIDRRDQEIAASPLACP